MKLKARFKWNENIAVLLHGARKKFPFIISQLTRRSLFIFEQQCILYFFPIIHLYMPFPINATFETERVEKTHAALTQVLIFWCARGKKSSVSDICVELVYMEKSSQRKSQSASLIFLFCQACKRARPAFLFTRTLLQSAHSWWNSGCLFSTFIMFLWYHTSSKSVFPLS